MKILWVSPFLPYASAGHAGGQAVHRWLSAAVERHEVTLVVRLEPDERPHLDGLPEGLRGVHLLTFSRPRGGPLLAARIAGSYVRLGRMARRLLRDGEFDLIHVDWLETGLGLGDSMGVPCVATAIDELTKPARRRMALASGAMARATAWMSLRAAAAVQRRVCRAYDLVLALSEQDRGALVDVDPRLSVSVLPFPVGIDATRFAGIAREPDHLLFVGAMNRDVNADAMTYFCHDVLPLVRRERPQVRLTIAGGSPTEEVQALADDPAVEVTGFVDHLEPYYARASAFVAPLRVGGGIISKNLDAMAVGCPVVTTTIGNEGIGATPGVHLLTADDPAAFAAAVRTALEDGQQRDRLVEAGLAFVRSRFSPEASADVLEGAHAAAAAAPRGSRLEAGQRASR